MKIKVVFATVFAVIALFGVHSQVKAIECYEGCPEVPPITSPAPITPPITNPGTVPPGNGNPGNNNNNNNSSNSNSQGGGFTMPNAPTCGAQKPSATPLLFQINTTNKTATLYFTPVSDASNYYIGYGYTQGDMRFGVQFEKTNNLGVQSYTINHLDPNKTYYFEVRAVNGCAPGDFSNSLKAVTTKSATQKATFYLFTKKG